MNKQRRKEIENIIMELNDAKSKLEKLSARIETVLDEEQDAFENLPEGIQDSERGDIMQRNIDSLENAFDGIDNAFNEINDAIAYFDDIE